LLQKKELRKLQNQVQNVGLTIVPLKLFLNDAGWAKLDIALCKGKKIHDKRNTLKERDNQRDLDRIKKNF
jgi:SsrA-binding protein